MDRRTKKALLDRLEQDALRICARFRLEYRVLEAEHANVKRRYGVCYSDGTIRVRLRHATSGKPLKYSSLVNTLCHELAHLRHFNHGQRFQDLYAEILGWARRERIYQPGIVKRIADGVSIAPAARGESVHGTSETARATRPKARRSGATTAPESSPSKAVVVGQLELFG
ncbi:MAG: M48 family metallopeptidase [Myxococcales bacterium]|nr:M48 family peptidase [Myxococcales bacterium]HIK85866.1 M48 family peptidase [Myxococcales bacterium]